MSHPEDKSITKPEVVDEGIERTRDRNIYSPKTDIIEMKDQYFVIADVPGVDEKGVNITLEKNVLKIEAHSNLDHPQEYSSVLMEYGLGDYSRSFVISDQIDREKIEAIVKDGVLKLVLPKAEPARTQMISVKAG